MQPGASRRRALGQRGRHHPQGIPFPHQACEAGVRI